MMFQRLFQRLVMIGALFAMSGAVSGCGYWEPEGTYELIQVWQGGTCGLSTPRLVTLTVTSDPEGNLALDAAPIGQLREQASVFTDRDECTFSFVLVEEPSVTLPALGMVTSSWNITEQDGDIQGSGMVSITAPDNCSQIFDVKGSKT